ncbi:MAG: HAD family hydrolase [Hespellia sp.]|nr:HAD family hydrolase [Hespellia sp.]
MEKKQKAALFFDIDGTLITEDTKKIPESAVEALRRAKENGHKVFINTGRTICSIPSSIKGLKFSGLLCGCGTYITYGDEVLFASVVPEERRYQYIDEMRKCNVEGLLEGTDDVYFSNRISRFEEIESTRRYMAALGLGVEMAMEEKNFEYDKLLIRADEKSDKEAFFGAIKEDLIPIDRTGGVYECIQKDYSKATCIEFMRKYFQLDMDQIYVFGDSSNDLAMFEYAQHTVAMKVHDPVLDVYTEFLTDTVEQDGIYKAMEHYGLI